MVKRDTSTHSHPSTRFKQDFLTKDNEIIWKQQHAADVNLFKIDDSGNILSQHSLYLQMDHPVWAPDNYIYSASNSTVYSKVDTAGNIIWMKIYPAGNPQVVNDICIQGNELYLAGYLFPNYPSFYPSWPLIHKIDAAGNILNSTVIAVHDTSLGILQRILPVADGGFIITSWRHMNRMVVIKTDSSFSQVTAYHNINNVNQVHDAAVTADGDFVLTAFHTEPQFMNKTLVLKTDISANLAPCFSPIAIDSVFNITSAYVFVNSNTNPLNITYIPSNIVDTLEAIIPLAYCITIGSSEAKESGISVYPNPAHHYLNIYSDNFAPKNIFLYNSMGQEILRTSISNFSPDHSIDVSTLSAGMYFLCIIEHDKIFTRRVIIE